MSAPVNTYTRFAAMQTPCAAPSVLDPPSIRPSQQAERRNLGAASFHPLFRTAHAHAAWPESEAVAAVASYPGNPQAKAADVEIMPVFRRQSQGRFYMRAALFYMRIADQAPPRRAPFIALLIVSASVRTAYRCDTSFITTY